MAQVTLHLAVGLALDGVSQREAVLREPTAGDVIEASREAEQIIATPTGYQLAVSPTLLSAHLLRRQVEKLGDIPGPLTYAQFAKLSALDLEALQAAAQRIEAASREVAERGRDAGPPAGPAPAGGARQ